MTRLKVILTTLHLKKNIKQKIKNDWLFYFAFVNPENHHENVELVEKVVFVFVVELKELSKKLELTRQMT
jgi:hypothetical protein